MKGRTVDFQLYELFSESPNGQQWRRECVADERTCLRIANEIEGTNLVFEPTVFPVRKAVGEQSVFFLNPSRETEPILMPGQYNHPYSG